LSGKIPVLTPRRRTGPSLAVPTNQLKEEISWQRLPWSPG
jgi:hypothetical protein